MTKAELKDKFIQFLIEKKERSGFQADEDLEDQVIKFIVLHLFAMQETGLTLKDLRDAYKYWASYFEGKI